MIALIMKLRLFTFALFKQRNLIFEDSENRIGQMFLKSILPLFAVSICLLCASCTDTPKVIDTKGIPVYDVHLNPMELEDAPLYPKGCAIADSLLVVFDPKMSNGFLSFYEKSGRLIGRYGDIGPGPDDYLNPRFISNGKHLSGTHKVRLGDFKAIYTLDIDSVLSGTPKSRMPTMLLNEELFYYNYVLYENDSLLIVNQTGDCQLTFYDKVTSESQRKSYYRKLPELSNVSDFCYTMQVYDGYYAWNDYNIVIAYKNRKQIDLVSFGGDLICHVYFQGYDYNDSKMKTVKGNLALDNDAKVFFTFVATHNNDYYLLCWDDNRLSIRNGEAKPSIIVIDTNGNMKAIYKLNKSISYFCIDNDSIYAIGRSENEDLRMYCSDIPK